MCACIRESLPVRNFNNSYLRECLTLEVTISNKEGYVITFYRSPSQTSDEFDSFISNLDFLINIASFDPHFVILLCGVFSTYAIYTFSNKKFTVTRYLYIGTYLESQSKSHYKIVDRTTGCVEFTSDSCKLFDWETFINKQKVNRIT